MTPSSVPNPKTATPRVAWTRTTLAGGIALVPLFLLERWIEGGAGLLGVVALASIAGIAVGVLLSGVRAALDTLPVLLRGAAWKGLGVAGGLAAARAVGAFDKLGSGHAGMAWLSILAGAAIGGLLGAGSGRAATWVRQRALADEPLFDVSATRVVIAALAMFGISVVVIFLEPTLWLLHGYPGARTSLVIGAWLVAVTAVDMVASAMLAARPHSTTWIRAGLVVLALVSVVIAARLGDEDVALLLTSSQARQVVAAIRNVSDVDRDGASSWLAGGDCAPFNPRIGPLSKEIPGNGIDDNCRYGDAPLLSASATTPDAPPPSTPSPLNVVLITIDSLRPDRTNPYGFARPTTPNLMHFAQEATRFDNAYTSGGWTALAVPSLFYGVYPRELGWQLVAVTKTGTVVPFPWASRFPPGESFDVAKTVPVEEPHPDLTWWLRRRGMRTAAVVAYRMFAIEGLAAKHFEVFRRAPVDRDDSVADVALEELRKEDARPLFLWVHFFEPHDPASDAPGIPSYGDSVQDQYDRDVAFCDVQIGRVLEGLDVSTRPTAVIVASDHGESFDKGLQFHGLDLFEDSLKIVLLARGPGFARGGVVANLASLLDIAPTVLSWTETIGPPGLEGRDLRALPSDRVILTDLWRHDSSGARFIDQVAATSAKQRLTVDVPLQLRTLSHTGDHRRPPTAIGGPIPSVLDATIGAYIERARSVP